MPTGPDFIQKKLWLSLLVVILTAGIITIFYNSKTDLATMKIGQKKIKVELAIDLNSRAKGLSGRDGLAKDRGLLMIFDNPDKHNIWMKDMKFPIDILWIKDGRVVHVEKNVPPPVPRTPDELLPIYRPPTSANRILEVAAGFADKNKIGVGDLVSLDSD